MINLGGKNKKMLYKKIFGTLIMTLALLVVGVLDVSAEDCNDSNGLCTPLCGWIYPDINNMDLVVDTTDGNTTMVAEVQETTTSGEANLTTISITPYHNATISQNTSQMGFANQSGPIYFTELDDGTYTLSATIFYENISSQRVSATQIACSDRQFIVDTTEGSLIPGFIALAEAEEAEKAKKDLATPIIVILGIGAAWIYFKPK